MRGAGLEHNRDVAAWGAENLLRVPPHRFLGLAADRLFASRVNPAPLRKQHVDTEKLGKDVAHDQAAAEVGRKSCALPERFAGRGAQVGSYEHGAT